MDNSTLSNYPHKGNKQLKNDTKPDEFVVGNYLNVGLLQKAMSVKEKIYDRPPSFYAFKSEVTIPHVMGKGTQFNFIDLISDEITADLKSFYKYYGILGLKFTLLGLLPKKCAGGFGAALVDVRITEPSQAVIGMFYTTAQQQRASMVLKPDYLISTQDGAFPHCYKAVTADHDIPMIEGSHAFALKIEGFAVGCNSTSLPKKFDEFQVDIPEQGDGTKVMEAVKELYDSDTLKPAMSADFEAGIMQALAPGQKREIPRVQHGKWSKRPSKVRTSTTKVEYVNFKDPPAKGKQKKSNNNS